MSTIANVDAQEKNKVLRWSIGGHLPSDSNSQHLGVAGPLVGIHHNVFILAGGANFPAGMPWNGGKKYFHKTGYIFKIDNVSEISFSEKFELTSAIAYGASCSTPKGVLMAGGESEIGLEDKTILVAWNGKMQNVSIQDLPSLPFPVTNASIACAGSLVFFAGGETDSETTDAFLCLDLERPGDGWKKLPRTPYPVSHAVMVTQSNGNHDVVFLIGGRKKTQSNTSVFYSSTFQFDLKTKKWSEREPLPFPLAAGTGISIGSKRILLFGGDKGETFVKTERLILSAKEEKDPVKKKAIEDERIIVQSTHPGFSKDILLYDVETNEWTLFGQLSFEAPVSTTALKLDDHTIVLPSGEVRAGIRTRNILTGKFVDK